MSGGHADTPPPPRSRPPGATRGNSIAFLGLGLVALAGAGYNVGTLIVGDRPDRLVVVGPNVVEIEHPDRSKPLEAAFRLRNPTRGPIRIIETRTGCSCTTTDLSGRSVPAGGEVTLKFRIRSFETYRDEFAERATVVTSHGDLELWVTGRVAPESEALAFPPRLFIEQDGTGMWPERTIRLRVPASCSPASGELPVLPINLGSIQAEVIEEPLTRSYREFLIRIIATPTVNRRPEGGLIRIDTGCTTLEIPVRFEIRSTEEGSS